MKSTFVMAQLAAGPDPEANYERAERAVRAASDRFHPDFIMFPESYMSRFPSGTDVRTVNGAAQSLDGPFVEKMRNLAKESGVWMLFGISEKVPDPSDPRVYNTIVMVNDGGGIAAVYRKTHLYDAFGVRESGMRKAGEHLFRPVDTPFGKIGMFVCYEVRFPEVARYEKAHGAEIILMPTDWYQGDLKSMQYHTLIRARAIENTFFVLACDQCGLPAIGESVAVDPMGVALASGTEGECLIPVVIDTERIREVEQKLPSFRNRRQELYDIEEKQ